MSFRAARMHAAEKEEQTKKKRGERGSSAADASAKAAAAAPAVAAAPAAADGAAAAAAAIPPSTRLCIKNLPVHMTDARLRTLFGAQATDGVSSVTDVKILRTADGRSRKMAFVGLRTLDDAARALKHFNKSFIDTSKVEVEYAVNPREAREALRPWSKYSEGSSRHDEHLAVVAARHGGSAETSTGASASKPASSHKPSAPLTKSALFGLSSDAELSALLNDPKFAEYLHVMGNRSKNKFWSNNAVEFGDGAADARPSGGGKGASTLTTAEEMAAVQGEKGFQTYEQYLAEQRAENKKKGKSGAGDDSDDEDDAFDNPMLDRDVDDDAKPAIVAAKVPAGKGSKQAAQESDEDDDDEAVPAANPLALDSAVSDLDYMRSKQLSAKGFDDDSDMEDAQQPVAASADDATAATDAKQKKKRKHADAIGTPASAAAAAAGARGSDAAAAAAPEEDGADAELRAEYEKEERAAEAAARANEAEQKDATDALESGRLFLRNLSYTVKEDDIRSLLSPFGTLAEVHLPLSNVTGSKTPKGFAYATFMFPSEALAAQRALDGSFFLGRLLHILHARPKPLSKSEWEQLKEQGDDVLNATSYKKKKELQMQAHSGSAKDQASWNTLFVRSDTVTEGIAAKYGLAKSDILDTTASGAEGGAGMAVRLALAETQLINETKKFLASHGVRLASFEGNKKSTPRSKTAIIVKNLPYTVELDEVRRLFAGFGPLGHVVMPPSRALVMLEFLDARDASKAFKALAYKKFKYVPLYLEWAPEGAFEGSNTGGTTAEATPAAAAAAGVVEGKKGAKEELLGSSSSAASSNAGVSASSSTAEDPALAGSSTLYVKNLNFSTTDAALSAFFSAGGSGPPPRSASIQRKKNTKARPGTDDPKTLSMGYGFVEFRSPAQARQMLAQLQGAQLDGHALDIKLSSRGATGASTGAASSTTAAVAPSSKSKPSAVAPTPAAGSGASTGAPPSSKLLIKNLPFETTARELRDLFSPFGSIQRIRIPKKFGALGHRGFAFVDFVSKSEAAHALDQVRHSHLYGRHLVIEYAAPSLQHDAQDVDELRAKTANAYKTSQGEGPANKKRKAAVDDDADDIAQAFGDKFK